MSTEPQLAQRPLTVGRILVRFLLTIAGIIFALFCFFLCSDMFAGYPRYGTEYLTWIGLCLLMATGGGVWIIDHRRLDAGDASDADGRFHDGN